MKTIVLVSVLALSGSMAQAISSANTTLFSVLCSEGRYICRVVVDAAPDARAHLLDPAAPIGARLERAMLAIRTENPDSAFTTQELAQIVLDVTQKYIEQAQ